MNKLKTKKLNIFLNLPVRALELIWNWGLVTHKTKWCAASPCGLTDDKGMIPEWGDKASKGG